LRPVLQSMGARHIVQSHFVAEASMLVQGGSMTVEKDSSAPLWEAVRHFVHALSDAPQSRPLDHPRPPQK
jgi:FMN reductase